jgi:hypothetical protein
LANGTREDDRGRDGGKRGDGFENAFEPVGGVPYVPHLHQVSNAAGDDEQRKQAEDPTKRNVAALTDEPQEGERDGEIGDGDRDVRDDVEPHELAIPQVTEAVWAEVAGAGELRQQWIEE